MTNLLEIENIVKKYDQKVALNNISLKIPKESVFGLLGPNGAGKTSLIRIINQITMPDSGRVFLDGEQLAPKHIAQIGYLPEERGLYKSMKVGEQVLYLAQLKGLSEKEAKKKLNYWFDKFEVSNWYNKKIAELSKGMAQKIQFIVTVLHQPKLLIFDEPFSGFDPVNAQIIAKEILQLREKGATIIFSTHRMESVEELCDEIALIDNSNKILDGKLNDIKKQFKTNVFQVGLKTKDKSLVKKMLEKEFEVLKPNFKLIDEDNLAINVKLNKSQTANDLLLFLTTKGEVNHFLEVVPSINDIFIEAVQKNYDE